MHLLFKNSLVVLGCSLLLAYGAAALGSFFTFDSITTWYAGLTKPALNPPNWIFGPVWTVLYAFMAIAAWRVFMRRTKHTSAKPAIILYAVHLAVNALWSIAFFGLHMPLLALLIIAVLWACIAALIWLFTETDRVAALLLVPYLCWVSFASFLNLMIVLLN